MSLDPVRNQGKRVTRRAYQASRTACVCAFRTAFAALSVNTKNNGLNLKFQMKAETRSSHGL